MKRIIDLLMSGVGLIVLSPVFAAVAVWIKLDSPGPVFYRGVRAGRFGNPFRIFKFRSMVMNADKIGGPSSSADDPRITRSGNFVRKSKLDRSEEYTSELQSH